jgi:hypothetical protein
MGMRGRVVVVWTVVSTVLVEAITIHLRFRSGVSAAEFNKTAPLLLQIHHMFWSVPLLVVVWLVWRNDRLSNSRSVSVHRGPSGRERSLGAVHCLLCK